MGFVSVLPFLCFFAYICIGLYVYKTDRKAATNKVYLCLCGSYALWSLSYALKYYSADIRTENFLTTAEYLALCTFVGLLMHIALLITGRKKALSRWWTYALIYAPGAVFFILRVTVFGSEEFVRDDNFEAFKASLFVYHIIYTVTGLTIFWLWGKRAALKREKRQARVIAATGYISLLLCSVNQIAGKFPGGDGIPSTPYVFVLISALGILYSVQRYKLMSASSMVTAEDILNNVTDLIILTTPEGSVIRVNTKLKQLLGYSEEELVGKAVTGVIGEKSGKLVYEIIDGSYHAANYLDQFFIAKSGERVPVDIYAAKIRDACGDISGIVIIGKDTRAMRQLQQEIDERKQAEERLQYLSMHDALTGLYNRTFFEQELAALEQCGRTPVSIAICDVDGLKFANDTLGHKSGDALLIAAADVLGRVKSENHVVARIGGDEFAILLKNSGPLEVEKLVSRLNEVIILYNSQGPEFPLNVSIGYATAGDSSKTMVDLFKEADKNMYKEKLSHRDSVRNSITNTLTKTMETRDFITEGHVEHLKKLVEGLAAAVGLSEQEIADMKIFAQFHDIGKVGIPERIWSKQGKLTPEELVEVKLHCEIGYRIAHYSPELIHISEWILRHHEWWNGEGYPIGLKGDKIPIQSRILAICDAYDAMTSDRPYRKAISVEMALEELQRCAGTQFDPELVKVFVELIKLGKNNIIFQAV